MVTHTDHLKSSSCTDTVPDEWIRPWKGVARHPPRAVPSHTRRARSPLVEKADLEPTRVQEPRSERSSNPSTRVVTSGSHVYDPECRVFLCNVPFLCNEMEVYTVMKKFGSVRAITMPREVHDTTGKNCGYCFVDFADRQDAMTAITAQASELTVAGRVMRTGKPNRQFGVTHTLTPFVISL
jgi:RNA recognition motif-containing protein